MTAEAPLRVVWSEGLLLSPQHIQQQDLYHERLLETRLGMIADPCWGVSILELDEGALAAGQAAVRRFRGVLPSGTPVLFDSGAREAPAPRPIDELFPPTQKALSVYLAVPSEREGLANVETTEEPGARPRYRLQSRQVADLTGGRASNVAVAFGRLNLALLFEREISGDYDSIKIGELVRTQAGGFAWSDKYIPPALHIGASGVLMDNLRRLLGVMAARRRSLVETTSERSQTALEFRAADVTGFLQLSAINGMLPVVQHLADTPATRPGDAHLLLSQLCGQLMAFSATSDPTELPKFAHMDLAASFGGLFDRINALLNAAVMKRFVQVELTLFKNGVLVGELQSDEVAHAKMFVLAVKPTDASISLEQLGVTVPKLSKIGSKGTIRNIVQAASNGVPLVVSHRPPTEIPIRTGVVYFILKTEDASWNAVLNERNIAVFIPPPYNPPHVEYQLIAVPEHAATEGA